MNPTCSIIQYVSDTETKPISFRDAAQGIIAGRWSAKVKAVRDAYAAGLVAPAIPKIVRGKMETDEEARHRTIKEHTTEPKSRLPGILFSGTFSYRNEDALLQHSGLICADLDDLGSQTDAIKERIAGDPHCLFAFVSPTGTGVKAVFVCDPTKPHHEAFEALDNYIHSAFGLMIDVKCADVSRICFVSHDPEAFIAETVLPLPAIDPKNRPAPKQFKPKPVHAPGAELTTIEDYNLRGPVEIPSILEKHGWTKAHGIYWTRPGKDKGTSASWGYYENTLIVYSDDPATGFPSDQKGFDPFAVYSYLEHNGFRRGKEKSRQENNMDRIAGPAPETEQKTEPTGTEPDEIETRRVRECAPPKEPETRLFLAGKPIATPGNLVTLISKAKTGKTATLGAAVSAIIGAHYDHQNLDTFKFTSTHTTQAVVLIDTEQSPYDAWTCHSRTLSRAAAQGKDPDWLRHYALVGYDHKQLKAALPKILKKASEAHQGIFTVILDGVADFVASVNDEVACNEFISSIRALSIEYNCPIICVIHSNEGVKTGDDGRGWLGKELTRKAESNLLLKKSGDTTTITSEKQRKAPITEDDNVAFRWSEEHGRHVSTTHAKNKKMGRPSEYDPNVLINFVPKPDEQARTMGWIHKEVREMPCGISDRSFRDMLAEWVLTGQVEKVKMPGAAGYKRTGR
jgi:hypothetical protein